MIKLNKRGKRVRSVLILIILIAGIWFTSTHHRVYGNCEITPDGRVCDLLRWEKNK